MEDMEGVQHLQLGQEQYEVRSIPARAVLVTSEIKCLCKFYNVEN